jgi:3-deoxy-D-manno-octulosonic-acid transferase
MVARSLYSLLLGLLLPLLFARVLIKSLRNRDYRQRLGERAGFYGDLQLKGAIWIHAVSVGEVAAAIPLLQRLHRLRPESPVIVTTTTPTGARQLASYGLDNIHHRYLPFDLTILLKRAIDRIDPALLIVMETELWPNLFALCNRRGTPVVVANARLSSRSAAGYRRIAPLSRSLVNQISLVAAQSERDRLNFLSLGTPADRVVTTGSVKFDLRITADVSERASALARMLGMDRPRWIAASTHDNEEEQILEQLPEIQQRHPGSLLILVPRHPERCDSIHALYSSRGIQVARRSFGEPCLATTAVYLVDTIGELLPFYAASEAALIGGTLIDHGGHNPIEPAALGIPLIHGPSMGNFLPVIERLATTSGVVAIAASSELPDALDRLLHSPELRQQASAELKMAVEGERGAAERMVAAIAPLIK